MSDDVRLSRQGLRVLKVFLDVWTDNVRNELSGADLARAAALTSGTVYPLLVRFQQSGILTSRWEEDRPQDLKRPRRKLYRLSPRGAQVARRALEEFLPGHLSRRPSAV